MKDDLISRTELLKEFEKRQKQLDMHGRGFSDCFVNEGQELSAEWWAVENIVENLPSSQQWIPSREKQPSIGETVLLNDGRYYAVGYLTDAFDWHVNGWYQDFDSWTAWMPLPEPYKGDV